MALYKTEHLD